MLKKNKVFKRIVSMVLALIMVITMLPVVSIRTLAMDDTATMRVHFVNTQGWENVNCYVWNNNNEPLNGGWPGNSVEIDAAGYYTYETTMSRGNFNFIFNNGSAQTADLKMPSNCYVNDGVGEIWVKPDSTVSATPPATASSISINGKNVTFTYTDSTVNKVYLAGTMNGWSSTANEMTKSGSTFTCTLELEPGMYEYKFVRPEKDSEKWIADPKNTHLIGKDKNSVVIVPGFVNTNLSFKKGSEIKLPEKIAYISTYGESTKAVSFTSATEGVTVNGTSVELADDFNADEFELDASAEDEVTTRVKVNIYEPVTNDKGEEIITIKIHYNRADGNYKDWNVWAWSDDFAGQYDLEKVGNEYIATIEVPFTSTNIKYKVRKGDWKEQEEERNIDLRNVVSGVVHSYAKSTGGYTNDTSEAILGAKIVSVTYDRNNNSVIVTSSGVIPDAANAFKLYQVYGDEISKYVDVKGTRYEFTLYEDLNTLDALLESYKITYDGNEYFVMMPNIYKTEEFENAYTYTGDDLGATWTPEKTTFKVWAPSAHAVSVKLYATGSDEEEGSAVIGTYPMTGGTVEDKGVWTIEFEGDLREVYYTYLTDVRGEVEESCDPYARTTGVNSERAMVVDLDSTDPIDWDKDISPNKGMSYTDAIIYELHVRDLSIDKESGVKDEWKGKFMGLTQTGTKNSKGIATGLDHIKDLGITHIHLLPSYDFGSIDETMSEEEKAANPDKQFNWGYDPVNYNVPEGSYSTNPYNGNVRVKEMKQMVQTLHKNNINVIMDVVYNHVYDAGNFCFNEIVPNYFSRTNADGSYSSGSGCGNDTASERAMVRKYIVDSVKYWADEYHIDGFRFDLVGLLDAETINLIVDEVHKTHPDVIFYGEGWDMVTAVQPSNTIMATQANAAQTPKFAYFSDRFRDFIKGKNDEVSWGFIQGATEDDPTGTLMSCFTANTKWIQNPSQVVNYASCHDNYTLKDKINATTKNLSEADRIKMNNLAASVYMLAEGIPLIHAGEEMLRTKVDNEGSIIHNSYNVPDYINSLKWGDLNSTDYQNVRDYYKGLIEFRKNHAALRLTTKDEVNKNVLSKYIDDDTVMFKINGKSSIADEVADEIVVIYNRGKSAKNVSLYANGASTGTWTVCVNDKKAGTDVLDVVTNGNVTVPAISTMVLVKGETVDTDSVYTKNAEAVLGSDYVKAKGRVTVKYVDEEGKSLASYNITGNVGEKYTTVKINIDGYTLKTTPSNASGTFTAADITVTYVYSKNEFKPGVRPVEPIVIVKAMKGFGIKKKTYNSVTLKWSKNTDATGYEIQQYKSGKWTTIKNIKTNKTTSYTIKGLKASTTYKFRIRAYKTDGDAKGFSIFVTKSVKTLPSNVANFKAATKKAKTITLKWTKNASADGYVIQQKKGKKWSTIKTIAKKGTTSFKVTKLKKNTKYQFRIRAYAKNGKTKLYSSYTTISTKTTK